MEEDFFRSSLFNEYFENGFDKEEENQSTSWIPTNPEDCEGTTTQFSDDPKSAKAKKEKRKVRNLRVDDFDYNKYINLEIQKQDMEHMPESAKKHMIQKIRNRMSAQRSRIRAKIYQEKLEQEKEILAHRNSDLQKQVEFLSAENKDLKAKIERLENSVTTTTNSDEEKDYSEISQVFRNRKTESFNLGRTSFFMLIALACVVLFPVDYSSSTNVRMGGVVPIIGSQLPKKSTDLKSIADFCKDYCSNSDYIKATKENDYLGGFQYNKERDNWPKRNEKTKQVQIFKNKNDRLVCFDLKNEIEVRKAYRLIVENSKNTLKKSGSNTDDTPSVGLLTKSK